MGYPFHKILFVEPEGLICSSLLWKGIVGNRVLKLKVVEKSLTHAKSISDQLIIIRC